MARPRFTPTTEQRAMVKSMAAMGISQQDIALKIGVRSPKTLRRHFHEELKVGAIDANYNVASTLYRMAISGEHPGATIFWAKTRNGFREHQPALAAQNAPPPFIVAREQEGGRP
jgi:hypothetical protein